MNGKDAIISSLLADAQAKADNLETEANEKAKEILSDAKNRIARDEQELRRVADVDAKEFLRRRISVAELEVKKYTLSLKQALMGQCFSSALEKMTKLSDEKYLKLIAGLLRNSEVGETVTINQKDKNRITKEFLDKTAKDKNLTLSKTYGDFCGGLILSKAEYEKNLTFEVLLKELREENEPQVSKILFEEN